jgi:PhnB protein
MKAYPYLNFKGQCEEAFHFYADAVGAKIVVVSKFGDSPMADQVPPEMKDKVIHGRIMVGDTLVMASDSMDRYETPKGFSMTLTTGTPEEAERAFANLSKGGEVNMPMSETFFAHRFGGLRDKFGIPWMVICEKQM